MHCFHIILLQAPAGEYPVFVIQTGIFVIMLTLFIVFQTIIHRNKKNRLVLEKKLLQEHFDAQMMEYKIEIQEASLESLGTELHDNVGQLLSTAKMFVGITERQLDHPPLSLISANEVLDRAIKELRDLSKSLNKEWLQQFDLYKNLLTDIERINRAGELRISLSRQSHVLPAVSEHQFILYRLLQEGIQNVIKHAGATILFIDIRYDEDSIAVILQDNGKGFNVTDIQTGLGIKNMKQRVKMAKGQISWLSLPEGTRVYIKFPIQKQ
jgi:signal transduction histidine kinase